MTGARLIFPRPVTFLVVGTPGPLHLRVLPGRQRADEPPLSDEALVEAFARGDRDVAELLYDRLIRVVDGTLYRVLGRRGDDHQDLVQSVFEQLVLTLSKRRFAGGCSLEGWAATLACHVAFNAMRSRQRERKVFDHRAQAELELQRMRDRSGAEHRLEARHEVDRLRRVLSKMDANKATTLLVHDVLGHTLAEIAAMTGSSVAATQSRLVRARRELRRRMVEDPEVLR